MKVVLPLISVALLLLLIYLSGINNLIFAFGKLNLFVWSYILIIILFNLFLRVKRWELFLKSFNLKIKFKHCAYSYLPSLFISNFTPGRVGEPIRSLFLKRLNNSSIALSLPAIIIERIIDILVLIILSSFFLLFFQTNTIISTYIVAMIFSIFVFLAILKNEKIMRKIFNFIFRVFSLYPKFRKFKDRSDEVSKNFYTGLKIKKSYLFIGILVALIIWILEGLIFYLVFISIGIEIYFPVVVAIFSFSVLIGVISFLPGGIGSMEFTFVLVLSSFTTNPLTTTGVILGRFLTFWLSMLISSFFWGKIR